MISFLKLCARYGRWCLVLGLIAGLTLPDLALAMRPTLPPLIALLLLLAAYRIGPRTALGNLASLSRTLKLVFLFQLAAPLVALAVLWPTGLLQSPVGLAVVLLLAAPPVTGSPNLTILMGHEPAAAMRQLLLGTALFPLTVVPILMLLPEIGDAGSVIVSALRLFAVIAGAVCVAFALRMWRSRDLSADTRDAIDGASAIVLGIVVIGLMSAVGPALESDPAQLLFWLTVVLALNLGLQYLTNLALRILQQETGRVAISVVAGNRNIALFLVALPAATIDPLLLFIGCYQVPMYLTPMIMRRLLR